MHRHLLPRRSCLLLLPVAFVLGAPAEAGGGDYPGEVLRTAGLVSYWRMEGGLLGAITDETGRRPLALTGTIVTSQPGALERDASLSVILGDGSYLAGASLPDFEVSEFTVELWVKFTALGLTSRGRLVFDKGDQVALLLCPDCGDRVRLIAAQANSAAIATSSAGVTPGSWYLLHAVVGSSGVKLYVNGVLDAEHPLGGSGVPTPAAIKMGMVPPTSSGATVQLDEVAFYSVALEPAVIRDRLCRAQPWRCPDAGTGGGAGGAGGGSGGSGGSGAEGRLAARDLAVGCSCDQAASGAAALLALLGALVVRRRGPTTHGCGARRRH